MSFVKTACLFSFLFLLSGCNTDTGVLPMGPDTYTMSVHKAPILGGADAAESQALKEANQYCLSQNRRFEPTQTEEKSVPFEARNGPTVFSLTFQCLSADDPSLQRPNLQPTPDVVIENRNE